MSNNILTKQGLEKLKKELEDSKLNKRKEVSERIKIAREFGDLKENSEYHEARNEQGFIEGRILELENIIKNSEIINSKRSNDVVSIGSNIKVSKQGNNMEFTILGSTEADPSSGKISVDSPLGKSFLNKKIGDVCKVKLPSGEVEYKIIKIN